MSTIFVSHASADKELTDQLVDLLIRLGSGVNEHLFYSSGVDTGVPSGADLNAHIRSQAGEAGLVVAVLTPQYLKSTFCIAELGAAWALTDTLFPLMVPGMVREDLGGVLGTIAIRYLDNVGALDELHDRVMAAAETRTNSQQWGQYRQRWLEGLPRLLERSGSNPAATERSSYAQPAPFPTSADLPERYHWGELFDSIVDAAFYIRDEQLASAEIEKDIRAGTLIPSKYHYSSDVGADLWIRLCREPTYRHHLNTTEYWADARGSSMAARILEELPGPEFDFVSLGPGDGQKDADLIVNWMNAGSDLIYYPYDISLPLTSRAVQRVRERTASARSGSLRVKAVLADFRQFSTMRDVFSYRSTPNVVGLLGSLGNLERELAFLRSLRDTLEPSDLVILEVRLQGEADPLELESDSSLHHDFGPLEHYLGIRFDRDYMRVERRKRVSRIPKTETVVVTCVGAEYNGSVLPEARLQYIHLYDPEAFLATLEKEGFLVQESIIDADAAFLECVLRRRL